MRKMFLRVILALFILFPLAVTAQTPACLETWVSKHEGQTPLMQWDPPPVWTNYAPFERGRTTCEYGVSLFDQVWAGPFSQSGRLNVFVYRASNNSGPFFLYVAADSSAAGILALDLSNAFGFEDRCLWSTARSLDLKNIPGFTFVPGMRYYLRVVVGSNSHSVVALRFCADESIGVQPAPWGRIKEIYR